MSESESDDGQPRKKKKYMQKFNSSWNNEEQFKKWLESSSKGSSYAFCKVCQKHIQIKSGRQALERHSISETHTNRCKTVKGQQTLPSMAFSAATTSLNNDVTEGEIRLAAFVAEHNLPLRVMEHLPSLITNICKDSKIAKNLKCDRTKTTSIIKNVTGLHFKTKLIEILKINKFSLLIDESTDRGNVKHLCLVCRVFLNNKVQDIFLGLLPVRIATAEAIYNKLKLFFHHNKIPYVNNMIGFAADGANNMMGAHNSVYTRFKGDIPNLFILKCICHSLHLCASYACTKLPNEVELLTRLIYNYFKNSPKRTSELLDFQKFSNIKPHKLLKPSQTRWLSLQMVVSRILEQYNALILYFTDAAYNGDLQADEILQKLKNPLSKLYFQFLNYILPLFTNTNKQFQSETPQIHNLQNTITGLLKTLLDCFIERNYLDRVPLNLVQYRDPYRFVEIEHIYFGPNILFTDLSAAEIKTFRTNCLNFYIESVSQIFKRFQFEPIFENLNIIDPVSVLSRKHISISPLSSNFPHLLEENNIMEIDREWRQLRNITEYPEYDNKNIVKFWVDISKICLGDGSQAFPILTNFIFNILILPHSSAAVERIFSSVNNMKTKIRNRLCTKTIQGLLFTKELIADKNCFDFEIGKDIKMLVNNNMYNNNSSNSEGEEEQ